MRHYSTEASVDKVTGQFSWTVPWDASKYGTIAGGRKFNQYIHTKVGRCRLTVSKPALKAPVVLAPATRISLNAFKDYHQFLLAPPHKGRALCRGHRHGS